MTNQHPKTQPKDRPRDDLQVDPGIGRSKGMSSTGEDPHVLDGASTFEGDTENQTNAEGGIDPERMPRRNK